MTLHIAILGGGPSGLMAAITAKRNAPSASVFVIEKNDRVGKKILASGNGHCNYSNANAIASRYNQPQFVEEIFQQFSPTETRQWFRDLGMLDREDESGRCYPYNQLASSVLDVLRFEAERLGIVIYVQHEVTQLVKLGDTGWRIITSQETFFAERVIIAMGGKAAPQLGTLGQGYELAKALGHHIRLPQPAIVMIEVDKETLKGLSGIRVDGTISLMREGVVIRQEEGEVLFKDNAVSGICTFILSSFIARDSFPATAYQLIIDPLPEFSVEQVVELLTRRLSFVAQLSYETVFVGLVHKMVAQRALELHHLDLQSLRNPQGILLVAQALKTMQFPVTSLGQFMHAQTTSGGILVKDINRHNLKSRLHSSLYFAGEVIDVDGECGGYSLQWAWSSGYVAGLHAATDN